jgi:hypothetical protein
MFRDDIAVIRAVQSDRISRDVTSRVVPELAPRDSSIRVARRSIGRSIVRFGQAVAADRPLELAR